MPWQTWVYLLAVVAILGVSILSPSTFCR